MLNMKDTQLGSYKKFALIFSFSILNVNSFYQQKN